MAGTIDQLNFEVILKDDKFEARIKSDIELAKQFNTTLSSLLELKGKLGMSKGTKIVDTKSIIDAEKAKKAVIDTAAAQERLRAATASTAAAQERVRTAKTRTATAQEQLLRAVLRTDKALKNSTGAYRTQSRLLGEMKSLALSYFSILGAGRLIGNLFRITGEFEMQKTTLSAMLGDLNKAEEIISNIKELAVKSPFQFKDLSQYAKQLSAYSIPAEELFDTTKMLADVSAGLGVGMDRIILAYGQIRSAAFLRGQEVRQLTEAGIPILAELSKQFEETEGRAISMGEVFDKISARQVPFEMVAKVFKDMTSEGGKFFNMQEIQAETLAGKISNLKDAYQIMLAEIGGDHSGMMNNAVDMLRNLMLNWERTGAIIKSLIIGFGAYKAALATVTVAHRMFSKAGLLAKFTTMNMRLTALTGQTHKFAVAMRVMGVTSRAAASLAVGALFAIGAAIHSAIRNATELNREINSIMTTEYDNKNKLIVGLEKLVDSMKEVKQGSKDYRDAISELNQKYGDYLPNILSEANAYEQVKIAAAAAADAIRNKAKADAFMKGENAIQEKFGVTMSHNEDVLRNFLRIDPSVTKEAASDIIMELQKTLETEGFVDVTEALKKAFNSYFNEGAYDEWFSTVQGLSDYKIDGTLKQIIKRYADIYEKVYDETIDLQNRIDEKFVDSSFSSFEERSKVTEVQEWYRDVVEKNEDALNKLILTQDEYNEKLREIDITRLQKLIAVYTELGMPEKVKTYQEQLDLLTKIQSGWKGVVNETLKGMGLGKNTSFGLWTDDFTQSVKYVDDMIKRYKELDEQINLVDSFDEAQAARLQQNKDAIIAVAKALNLDIEEMIKTKSTKTGDRRKKSQEQIDLEMQIDLVKKLQAAYEDLQPFLNDPQMRNVLSDLFPGVKDEWLETFDFDAVLMGLAQSLSKFDKEASDKLQASLAKGVASGIADSFKEVEAYKDMLDEWLGEDFDLSDKGARFDVTKIIRDLNNEYAKIDQKRLKALALLKKAQEGDEEALLIVRKTYGEEFWNEYITQGEAAINALAKAEKNAAQKTSEERIRDRANEYVKQMLEESNVDLTDFGDKTTSQIRRMLERMNEMILKVKTEMASLYMGGVSEEEQVRLEGLAAVLDILQVKIKDTGDELDKKIGQNITNIAKGVSSTFSDLGDEISQIGEDMSDGILKDMGERMKELGDFVGDMASKVSDFAQEVKDVDFDTTSFKDLSESAKGGLIGIIAGIVTMFVSSIKKMITSAQDWKNAMKEASATYREAMEEIRRESHSDIFGTDEMALATENAKIAAEALDKYRKSLEKVNEVKLQGVRSGGGLGRDNLKNQSLIDILNDYLVGDVYTESGELDMEKIKAYYDTYAKQLTRKQRKLIDELIENYDIYNDAAAQEAQYLTDLFSGVADNIADSMIDAFLESGDAAIDMGEIMGDVAKKVASDLIQNMFIRDILGRYEQELQKVASDQGLSMEEKTAAALNVLDNALGDIESVSPQIQAILEGLGGYLGTGEGLTEESASLGDGIKGVTEDTANLLASYLNAIRADVSYSKTLWESMDANIRQLMSVLSGFSAPSLMEYMTRIEANTFNTAVSTQALLNRIDSVLTSEGGQSAIRIYS